MNIKILSSWAFRALTNSLQKVQYKHLSIIYHLFSTGYTDWTFSSVSVVLDRIFYFISGLLGQYLCAFLFWPEAQAVLQSLSSSLSIGFTSTKSKPSLLHSIPWLLHQAMRRGLSPLRQTALCMFILLMARASFGCCGFEIKWLTLSLSCVHFQ